jgi:hypothetical protein
VKRPIPSSRAVALPGAAGSISDGAAPASEALIEYAADTGNDVELSDGPRMSRLEKELDDAVYFLRHGCEACAERHFHLARRRGATEEEIAAAYLRASTTEE